MNSTDGSASPTVRWSHKLGPALNGDGAEFLESQVGISFPWLFRPHEWIVGFKILPASEGEIAQLRVTRLEDEPGLTFEAVTTRPDYDPVLIGELERAVVTAIATLTPTSGDTARLRLAAERDALTGILSRYGFEIQAERIMLTASELRSPPLWVYVLDLDDFKAINDERGHWVGDRVLKAVARRLEAQIPPDGAVARRGGDEFVAALTIDASGGESLLNRFRDAVEQPIEIDGDQIAIGISVGTASASAGAKSIDELVREADAAMYRVKRAKKTSLYVGV
ncbi:GGDEF domain-containing protein [Actinoplanes auranticolor]|uniref:GGDEF domain-containing protein n=1 Tax=Actinoplanes auranticolor TaxID=47988 RepID=A0A919S674_9ACTN|nr:GGDEF domain-containing protein [Actinoplanes auranticolor]GIM64592.1 hypothetical protein Aau02nite_11430 [Actinoplanes auranticolor]